MLTRYCAAVLLLFAMPAGAEAGYLDENPDEVFAAVHERIGHLPVKAARDPYVWLRLEELKREPCDQKSIGDLALGLLGMSFLSRFEVQMAGGSIEIRTGRPKK